MTGGTVARRVLAALGPALPRPALREVARAGAGAALGLLICGFAGAWVAGAPSPALFAPLGATAVLAVAVPNSPLAQPWSAVVGNAASALVAVAVLRSGMGVALAPALAVGLAIAVMMVLRALHPPGAAVALLIALNPALVAGAGFGFALVPVALDTALLVALAVVWNRATGRVYPFRQPQAPGMADLRVGPTAADLAPLLQQMNLGTNIGAADLVRVIRAAEADLAGRRFGPMTTTDLMTRDPVTIAPEATLADAAGLLRRHDVGALPVVDADGQYLGLLSLADAALPANPAQPVAEAMRTGLGTLPPDAPMAALIRLLAAGHQRAVPILQGGRVAGIVTRGDLMAALLRRLAG